MKESAGGSTASAEPSSSLPHNGNEWMDDESFGECQDSTDRVTVEGRPCDHNNSQNSCVNSDWKTNKNRNGCWTAPAVKRVVILILDALRFDFVAPSSLLTDKPKPWMDKLQVMQQLVLEEKSAALIFKFIADPPTTSLQRLKGLTTGSLPTFIDVGNSFGAPAIVEDNLLHQLSNNGKRILMMGDDTWLQLFPTQFAEAHPFPSFNVKDLHTVDDGVVNNLFPALYQDDWDVLIGHFLGVDHVGHIFGVESPHMVEKLEQYNRVIEEVISILQNQSQPGGLHEDTLLLVMGDHGQTLNGDHGGGTPEEVETALFAMSTRQPARSIPSCLQSSCSLAFGKHGEACIRTFPQLDFAATLAALIGVPFPFGSIGRVNPEMFALAAGTWPISSTDSFAKDKNDWLSLKWMEHYLSVLCLNSWQVNRYFELYAESALSGFPPSEYLNVHNLYVHAQSFVVDWPWPICSTEERERATNFHECMAKLAGGIDAYSSYLDAAAALARSKWTQFGNGMMAFGLVLMAASFSVHIAALCKASTYGGAGFDQGVQDWEELFPVKGIITGSFLLALAVAIGLVTLSTVSLLLRGASYAVQDFSFPDQMGTIISGAVILGSALSYIIPTNSITRQQFGAEKDVMRVKWWSIPKLDTRGTLAVIFVAIYACSLLSNSYILKEGQVVTFFLASSGVLDLRRAIQAKSKVLQAVCFLGLNFVLGSITHMSIFKDTEAIVETLTVEGVANLTATGERPVIWRLFLIGSTALLPLCILGWLVVKQLWRSCLWQRSGYWVVSFGLPLTYIVLSLHWLLEDLTHLQVIVLSKTTQEFVRLQLPRMVYSMIAVQTLVLICSVRNFDGKGGKVQLKEVLEEAAVPVLAVWSGLLLLLLGRQGPLIALIAVLEGWCLMNMQSLCLAHEGAPAAQGLVDGHSATTVQWSLFSVQLFFCTGHRCTFDGLRYAAAFIGFDQFNLYRQGILLAADTFGASHILPVIGLPLLVSNRATKEMPSNTYYKLQMSQAFLLYGLVRVTTTIITTVCVTIQRRHLMVWGLFAPKFVFDAIGLLLTDSMLVLASLYYFLPFFR